MRPRRRAVAVVPASAGMTKRRDQPTILPICGRTDKTCVSACAIVVPGASTAAPLTAFLVETVVAVRAQGHHLA
jgi:hypothetical protein